MKKLAILAAAAVLSGCGGALPVVNQDANGPHSLATARAALTEGQAETALGIATALLAENPRDFHAMVAAGDAQLALGERNAAAKSYAAALHESPNFIPAQIGAAKMRMRDDVRAAELAFRDILTRDPRNAAALTDLGVTLDLQGKHKAAQVAYAQALAQNADLTSARVDLALSLALSGEPERAEAMLRDASDSAPVPTKVRANYALAQVLAGRPQDAELTLRQDLPPEQAHNSVLAMQALLPGPAPAATPATPQAKPASSAN